MEANFSNFFIFKIMKWLIERARYLPVVSVLGMLVGAVAALFLGVVKTVKVVQTAFTKFEESEPTLYTLFEALDCFLIATALIVVAIKLYTNFLYRRSASSRLDARDGFDGTQSEIYIRYYSGDGGQIRAEDFELRKRC